MCVLVWSGAAGRGMARRFRRGAVRHGLFWRGMVRLGGSGMLGSGKLDYGMAVGVWFGEARSVLAVKLTNKWWAVVAHYTNIRNFLEDSICLVLIRRPSSVS